MSRIVLRDRYNVSIFNNAFNLQTEPPESRLRLAVFRNDIKTMQDLIKRGVDINAQDNKGFTALIIAARQGRKDCARILIGHGADLDKVDNQGHTALIWASFFGYTEIATMLVDKGADLDARGKRGTALTCATFFGREEIVDALLRHGADIDMPDPNGDTAIKLARKKGHEIIDKMLHDVLLKKVEKNLRGAARNRRPRPKFKP